MLFRQALTRELTQIAGAVFVTLFTIMLTTQSIRFLGLAAGGDKTQRAREVVEGLFHAMLTVIQWILWLMPIGLFCFLVGIVLRVFVI